MGLHIIAEAVLRLEHKLDIILDSLFAKDRVFPQMSFVGQVCPVCRMPAQYNIDVQHRVVVRQCQCSTGKVAPTFPLYTDPNQGLLNGDAPSSSSNSPRPQDAKDRDGGKGR